MADDYWGENERAVFEASMARVFPERPIVEIKGDDPVLHVCSPSMKFTQIPGLRHVRGFGNLAGPAATALARHLRRAGPADGRHELQPGRRRFLGRSRQPDYPEPMTALGYRFGINYIVYAMTH